MRSTSFSAAEIHEAYVDRRHRKRGTANALHVETNQAVHLLDLKEVLKVAETGYPPYRLRERLPTVLRVAQ